MPPSSLSTTPFNMIFSIPWDTSCANSWGLPGLTTKHQYHFLFSKFRSKVTPGVLTWKLHHPRQTRSHFITHHSRHPGIEQTRRYSNDSNTISRQISRHRQCERGDGSLGGGVGDLAWLAVESCRGGDHDYNAAFAIFASGCGACDVWENLAD